MAWCCQYWLLIICALCHSPNCNFTGKLSSVYMDLKNYIFRLQHFPGVSEFTHWGLVMHICVSNLIIIIPTATKLGGYIGFTLSVCLYVCPLTFRVCPVASTVQDGFFLYLVQMINSMRGCVACDDTWHWPISLRSFGLDLENRVHSVASTVLDGFFLCLAQIITIIRGCVVCYVFSGSGNLNFWQICEIFRPWPWKKNLQFLMDSFHI